VTFDDLPLFDPRRGAELRDIGMQRASDNAGDQRIALAREALRIAASNSYRVTHDDLWQAMDDLGIEDFNPPAIGAIWRHGISQGWIERTTEFTHTKRAKAHKRTGPVYRSLLFDAF